MNTAGICVIVLVAICLLLGLWIWLVEQRVDVLQGMIERDRAARTAGLVARRK